jgi:hypothetical protein
VRHFLSRASFALVLVCGATSSPHGQTPGAATPPDRQTTAAAPASDLDELMKRALATRDVNRQTMQQYILDEAESFEILGPGRTPLRRSTREFSWYVRDGVHVRSPVRFDGVTIGDEDRRKYEDDWLARERARLERRAAREAERQREGVDPDLPTAPPVRGESPGPTPRFVSEAYFMDFKFEPGNYYLAGRETLAGVPVLRIEYYPTAMFRDGEREDGEHGNKAAKRDEPKNPRTKQREEDISRKMNKTSLVTLWVDPAAHQIVKYTFDNVWMDFLPGAWLVRVDGVQASMTMGQPFAGVWLPGEIDVHARFSLASGPFDGTYTRRFSNYKLADVRSIIRIPKGAMAAPRPGPRMVPASYVTRAFPSRQTPAASPSAPVTEIVREIRVQGNTVVPDADVITAAGIAVGQPLPAAAVEEIEHRLVQSGKFQSVEVRKRYRSISDPGDVAIILVVHEHRGTTSAAGVLTRAKRPFGRLSDRLMFLPILSYTDGYGFSYGARATTTDLLGAGERLSVPLTWGGTRRAALEMNREFETGPLTRITATAGISQHENPHFHADDRRTGIGARAERRLARVVLAGVAASQDEIHFGAADDRLRTIGVDVAVDTRASPSFPRNAVVIGGGWSGLHFREVDGTIARYTADARGYLGLIGQAVLAARAQYAGASAPLPSYERLLLGGASTLRGFRAGTFDADRTLVTSIELRVPVTSVLSRARLGVTGFADAAAGWDADARLADAPWHRGVGGGVFIISPFLNLNLDLAHGLSGGDTRLHLAAGFGF